MINAGDMIGFKEDEKEVVEMFGFKLADEYELISLSQNGKSIQVINDEGNHMSFGIERFKL